MSGFCGWAGCEATEETKRANLERMVRAMTRYQPAETSHCTDGRTALATARRSAALDWFCRDGLTAVVAGSPYFTDDALASSARERGPAAALAGAYRERGAAILDSMRGGFSLAILRGETGEALLAIDVIGGRFPLCYRVQDGCLVFATLIDAFQAHPLGAAEVDPQALYNYLYLGIVPGPGTVRKDVLQLLPGTRLVFSDGRVEVGEYRQPSFVEHGEASVPDLEREFHEVLRDSMRRCLGDSRVGCFLSGGTDSSTVAGMVGELTGTPARTYSIGFGTDAYDETRYARIAARHFGTEHHEYFVTPADVVDLIPEIARTYAQPMGNASAVAVYHCARIAREDGVDTMLGGDGGDELFAGNERYAEQRVFEAYQAVPLSLRRLLEPLVFEFPGGGRILPLRKARSYITQANMPLPARLEYHNHLDLHGVSERLDPDFLASVDTGRPLQLMEKAYHGSGAGTVLNRLLAMDFRFTLADNDLPKVSRMCELAGVGVEYPLLTDEMLEFSCRLPVRLKLKGRRLRWFWKHALRDFLPGEVLKKPKHGMGVPVGLWMNEEGPLRDAALDSLNGLASRGIFLPGFVDHVLRLHAEVHSVFYGAFIWSLVQLEQWFRHHEGRAGTA